MPRASCPRWAERMTAQCYHTTRRMPPRDGSASAVVATVVDDLAVVRKLAFRMEHDVAAKLGDVADRRDDSVGSRRSMRRYFDVQRHPVRTVDALDDEPAAHDLRMAPDDRGDLRRMYEHAFDLGGLIGASHPPLDA